MKFQASCLLLLITLSFAIADEPTGIVMLFRHGARGPSLLKWDKSWGSMAGELTGVGMRQQYLRGAYLSKIYPNLFSTYDASKISIRSTDFNRTIMTVYSMLDGLYQNKGPSFADTYPFNLTTPPYPNYTNDTDRNVFPNRYQPAPIHTVELDKDELLFSFGRSTCPTALSKENANEANETLRDVFFNKMNDTVQAISKLAKFNRTMTMKELVELYDTSIANYFEGKPDPVGIDMSSALGKNFTFLNSYYQYFIEAGTPLQKLLYSMNPLNQFQADIDSILNGSKNVIRLYSAHDATIVPVLAVMGIADCDCLYKQQFENLVQPGCEFPPYATAMRFEVYKNDTNLNSSSIKLFVNEIDFSCKTGGCNCTEGVCTWPAFKDLIQNYTQGKSIDYYRSECGLTPTPPAPTPNTTNGSNDSNSTNGTGNGTNTDPSSSGSDSGLYIAIYTLGGVAGVLLVGIIVVYKKKQDYETVPNY